MQSEKHHATCNHALIVELYQRYGSALLMYACQQVPTREDAEDVLLEVFQAAAESETLPALDADRQRSWLWTVAHNKTSDHYRRARHRPLADNRLEAVADALYDDDFYDPESVALRQETHAELRSYVSELTELQQQVLRLRFAHGLRCSEIAQQLNKSGSAIRIMLSRTLNLLRDRYKQGGEDQSHGQK